MIDPEMRYTDPDDKIANGCLALCLGVAGLLALIIGIGMTIWKVWAQ